MADSFYALWIGKVLSSEPSQFILYAIPKGGEARTLTSPLLSRAQALSALARFDRSGLCPCLERVRSGKDQQIDSDFPMSELIDIGPKLIGPYAETATD